MHIFGASMYRPIHIHVVLSQEYRSDTFVTTCRARYTVSRYVIYMNIYFNLQVGPIHNCNFGPVVDALTNVQPGGIFQHLKMSSIIFTNDLSHLFFKKKSINLKHMKTQNENWRNFRIGFL